MIPAYFLLVLADGRRLRARLRIPAPAFAGAVRDGDASLAGADYPLWMSRPLVGSEASDKSDEAVLLSAE